MATADTYVASKLALRLDSASGLATAFNPDGTVASTRPLTTSESAALAAQAAAATQGMNQTQLLAQAATAIANNITFLGLATPTQAQAVAQVQALTRQVNALLRLSASLLDSTAGT